jgi:acetamidase/formamidase
MVHWGFYEAALKPVLTLKSGDILDFDTTPQPTPNDAAWQKVPRGPGNHILLGPVAITDAAPGDVLEVKILDLQLAVDTGNNAIRPEYGTLPEDFPYFVPGVFQLDRNRNVGLFKPGIEIPLRPFLGSVGVAPSASSGRISSRPPGYHAGNIDNKELVVGTTLLIPVHVRDALLSLGDAHAAQGDGEVNGLALETSLAGKLQLVLKKGKRLKWPRIETPTHYIVMGFHPDLDEAMRVAVRETIDFLVDEKGLTATKVTN